MEPVLKYSFDHERGIIFERISGRISFNELLAYEEEKLRDPDFNDSYAVVGDIRGAVFGLSKEEIIRIYRRYVTVATDLDMRRRFAFITDNPDEVVAADLFRISLGRFFPWLIEIFSTEEAALQWISVK